MYVNESKKNHGYLRRTAMFLLIRSAFPTWLKQGNVKRRYFIFQGLLQMVRKKILFLSYFVWPVPCPNGFLRSHSLGKSIWVGKVGWEWGRIQPISKSTDNENLPLPWLRERQTDFLRAADKAYSFGDLISCYILNEKSIYESKGNISRW